MRLRRNPIDTVTVWHAFGKNPKDWEAEKIAEGLRTEEGVEERVKLIAKTGFSPGYGDLYGKGLYAVYSPRDISGMYGPFVIQFEVLPYGFLILDYNLAAQVFGPRHTLCDQLEKFGLRLDPEEVARVARSTDNRERIQEMGLCAWVDKQNRVHGRTGSAAYVLSHIPEIKDNIDGIFFDGSRDGHSVVGYYPDTFKVTGWDLTHPHMSRDFDEFLWESGASFDQQQAFVEDAFMGMGPSGHFNEYDWKNFADLFNSVLLENRSQLMPYTFGWPVQEHPGLLGFETVGFRTGDLTKHYNRVPYLNEDDVFYPDEQERYEALHDKRFSSISGAADLTVEEEIFVEDYEKRRKDHARKLAEKYLAAMAEFFEDGYFRRHVEKLGLTDELPKLRGIRPYTNPRWR